MTRRFIAVALLLISAGFAFPLPASAEDGNFEGSVTLGTILTDLDKESFKHGEYDGIVEDGAHLIGEADVVYEKDSYFMRFGAEDAGLDNRSFSLENGRYGIYNFYLEYDQIPHFVSNTGKTPFAGAGSENLTLPAFFNSTTETTYMNLSNLNDVDLETKRKTGTVGYKRSLRENLDFSLSFKREKKEGIKSIAGLQGSNGGNAVSAVLPEPVDYTTDEIEASLAYIGENSNVEFAYLFSRFENDKDTLAWETPFSFDDSPDYATGPDALLSLPPDNRYQRFSLTGGLNLEQHTRISAIAEYGKMEQDETLLPYSVNSFSIPVPRNSAEAEIDVTHFGLNISSRPAKKLALGAKYRYYETDNKTPRELFQYAKADNLLDVQAAPDEADALYSNPFDYKQNELKLDASYAVLASTKVRLGFEYDAVDRSFREVEKTEENTYKAGFTSRFGRFLTAVFDFFHAEREAEGDYDHLRVYETYHDSAYFGRYTSTDPASDFYTGIKFDNHPDMRRYDIADRDRDSYNANVTLLASENTTVGLFFSRAEDDYENSLFGLQDSRNLSYTVDVSASPSKNVSLFAYYTRDDLETTQASRDYRGFNASVEGTESQMETRNWWADHDDENNTVGTGANIVFLGGDLIIDANYVYARSKSAITFRAIENNQLTGTGPPVPSYFERTLVDLPDLETERHTFKITGKYKIDKKISVGLGYEYERYKSDDWSTNGFDPASSTIPEVLTLTGSTPDYRAHLVKLFLTYNL